MRSLRILLSVVLATYMTGANTFAQESSTSSFSINLEPVQYASVKGNVAKFEALNWMPSGDDGGISNITFIKDINKNLSLDLEGIAFPSSNNYDDELILKNGDLSFLKINYKAFRKYFDGTGGSYHDLIPAYTSGSGGTAHTFPAAYIPGSEQGVNVADLHVDISYFKLEAGLGEISDPFLDVSYEHNVKDGNKSLLQWTPAYNNAYWAATSKTSTYREIGPSYQSVDDTTDIVTLKEKKDIAGVTIKGEQTAEVDYNHNITYMPYLSPDTSATIQNQLRIQDESPNAKLFGSGVRFEKWMLNDSNFVGFGYHYNHTRDSDGLQNEEENSVTGVITDYASARQSLWSYSRAAEDEHVWTTNFNSMLTPDLAFLTDARYEHNGSVGNSQYLEDTATVGTISSIDTQDMENHQDNVGEHVSLRYSGIPHTSLYVESDLEQNRDKMYETYFSTGSPTSDFLLDRLNRTQKESWAVGGRIIPNRFFTFTTELKQRFESDRYDTLEAWNPANQTFLDSLSVNGLEETSTLTWRPYRWIQNSFKYQFLNTLYQPLQASEGTVVSQYYITQNRMLTSQFTYDITVEPIDPLMLMVSYSHIENYVRTIGASSAGGEFIPTFNSGDNSWLFSASYTPTENVVLTNSVVYTISPNYVDYSTGVPLGTSFKQLTFSTGLQYTYHKWLKIGPTYEYASYRGNSLVDGGTYSANIFELNVKFDW